MVDDERRCTATANSTGERCKRAAIKGSNVCYVHGGAASQVQEKAQERLDRMADSVTADVQETLQDLIDLYDEAPPEDKPGIHREIRQAWTAILDRTDHGPTETKEHTGEDGDPINVTINRQHVTDGNN